MIVNELKVLHQLGIHEDRSATEPEIWEYLEPKLKKLIAKNIKISISKI